MNKSNEKLNQCFDRLQQRLFSIKAVQIQPDSEIDNPYIFKHTTTEILGSIMGVDGEDAQDHLLHYRNQVEEMLSNLDSLIKKYTFKNIPANVFSQDSKASKRIDTKRKFKTALKEELTYYKIELDQYLDTIIERDSQIGNSRFSNAGFKLKLNLTVQEMGYFFNMLFKSGLIIPESPSLTKPLTKKELGTFLLKNFSSRDKDNLSLGNIINNLSYKDPAAEKNILNWLEKWTAIAEDHTKKA